MNSVFNEKILADKLSKLNSTQQCIETLSHWCIFHRKAELVVQTWDKQFHSSQKEQKVPFLYLANDILQNSKRKGTEFVSEFWKVLPAALKDVAENGDDRGKKTVSRLVDIWEERRVFGSRARGLKNLMLGNEPPPPLELNKKRSRAIRILRRDSRSIKIKLAIGGTAEKIVSSFHSVLSEYPNEETDLNKCKAAVRRVGKMEKDVDNACIRKGDPRRTTLAEELQEEENLLKQCIERLKSIEESRVTLVSQLKEALQEQVAQAQVEEASNMRRRLNGDTSITRANPSSSSGTPQVDQGASAGETPKKTAAAIAAEVADKLAASTSSQQIMTSVLSTFAAQEAKHVGLMASTNPSNTEFPSEKRQKLENSMPVPDASTFITAQPHSLPATHQHPTVFMHQPSIQAQASTSQPQYTLLPTLSSHQYMQPSGGMMIGMPYGYSTLPPPPPPLPPAHVMNLARPAMLTQQPMALQQSTMLPRQQPVSLTLQQSTQLTTQQQAMSLIQQQPAAAPSFRPLQPPTMGFYGHPHQTQ
ncbi:UPF0400 protein C337.03 isoform X2 [Magnolia sinica]|uniref:UPF0400 protein C337.03 isoform X2 n=1 Tax=Magnolia sinica TaxID=86752 RepID=UPI00265A2A18|nr:UPF0400 protein C337.03 isoform X2 [Magnolia sinica]